MFSSGTIETLLSVAIIFTGGLMKIVRDDKNQNSAQFLWGIFFALVAGWGLDRILAVLTDHNVALDQQLWSWAFGGVAFIVGFFSGSLLKLNNFTLLIGLVVFAFGLTRMNYYAIDNAGDTLFSFHEAAGHSLYSWVHVLIALIIACPMASWCGAQAGLKSSSMIARRRELGKARPAAESPSQPQPGQPPQTSYAFERNAATGTDVPPPPAPARSTTAPPALCAPAETAPSTPAPAPSRQTPAPPGPASGLPRAAEPRANGHRPVKAVPGRPAGNTGPQGDVRFLLDAGLTGDMTIEAVRRGPTTI